MFMSTLADRVNQRMSELDLTQDELAKKIGISQTAVFKITSGQTAKPRNILELAAALRVHPDWLSKGFDPSIIEGEVIRPQLPPGFANVEQAKPPVIDDETWKTQSPKTRALIEEILIKTASKQLDDDDIKLLQNMADKLTKK